MTSTFEFYLRIAPPVFLHLGTVADDDLGAGNIQLQEGFQVLLHRDAADIHGNRACIVEERLVARVEQAGIDAARPAPDVAEALGD